MENIVKILSSGEEGSAYDAVAAEVEDKSKHFCVAISSVFI